MSRVCSYALASLVATGRCGLDGQAPAASSQHLEARAGQEQAGLGEKRHGPAAAWQTTGRPTGERVKEEELEDQEKFRLEGRYLSQNDWRQRYYQALGV